MLATIATALLALASPLIGFSYEVEDRTATRTSSPAVLHPRTLEPAEGAASFPRSATSIELSPDGERFAAVDGEDLVLLDAKRGERLGRMALSIRGDKDLVPTLSWIAPRRILVLEAYGDEACGFYACLTTRIRVVDPEARTVLGDPLIVRGLFRTSRVAGRQIVVLHNYFGPRLAGGPPSGPRDSTALVLDADGHVVHELKLSGLGNVGGLDHDLVTGFSGDGGTEDVVLRIDPLSGAIDRRAFAHQAPEFADPVPTWRLPAPDDAAFLRCYCPAAGFLDRSTLEPLSADIRPGTITTMPSGYLTRRKRSEDYSTLTAYSLDGDRRWRRKVRRGATVAAIGRYVYAEHRHRGPDEFIDVIRARDGRRVAHVRGQLVLTVPQAGRSFDQVPRLQAAKWFDE